MVKTGKINMSSKAENVNEDEAPPVICSVCDVIVEEDSIACDKCNGWKHALCSGLNHIEFRAASKPEVEWICNDCKDPITDGGRIEFICTEIKRLKSVDAAVKEIHNVIENISANYEEVLLNQKESFNRITNIEEDFSALNATVGNLKNKVNYLQQEALKNDVVITGVNVGVKKNSELRQLAKALFNSIDAEINENNISLINQSKKSTREGRKTLFIKFDNYNSKQNLMKNKKKLKDIDGGKIKIFDATTELTWKLFNYTKLILKEKFKYISCSFGRVTIKKEVEDVPIIIRNEDQVDEIMTKLTVNPGINKNNEGSISVNYLQDKFDSAVCHLCWWGFY